MEKPIIFFSHSTQDKDKIFPIQERLLSATKNTIEVFMSSDGNSIRMGTNWLKKIEDALQECKLMFVWITPQSLKSTWVPFELGYAYSKGIKVVPIGFNGVRVEDLPPPINILQGFNIISEDSLHNVVQLINEEFQTAFENPFDNKFYERFVQSFAPENPSEILDFVLSIKCGLYSRIQLEGNKVINIQNNAIDVIKSSLEERKALFSEKDKLLSGMGFRIKNLNKESIQIDIDPFALNTTWEYLAVWWQKLYEGKLSFILLEVELNPHWQLPDDEVMVSARLVDTEINFDTRSPCRVYKFRDIDFEIRKKFRSEQMELVLFVPLVNSNPIPILPLMKLLEERRVLSKVNTHY